MDDEGYARYQAFLKGDAASFDWLVVRYRNGLTGFLQRILRDYHSAEELAEDVFVSLYFKRPVLSPGSNLRTWLYSAGKNKAINHIRWKERHKTVELSEIDASGGDEDTVLHSLYLDERKIALHRALDELPVNYRLVLHLHYFESMTAGEISSIMKLKPRAVSDAIYNAKKALRAVIENGGEKYEIIRSDT